MGPRNKTQELELQDEIVNLVEYLMNQKGITKADLARRMGISRARVGEMFTSEWAWTLRTLSRVLTAIGYRLTLTPVNTDEPTQKAS